MRWGVKFSSGADASLGGSTRAILLATRTMWMDKPAAQSGGATLVHSDNLLKVTWPNKSNVVTVTPWQLMRKKIPQLYVEKHLSSHPSYQLFVTFLPEKQCLSPAKTLNHRAFVMKINHYNLQCFGRTPRWTFPRENNFCPHEWVR